VINMKLGFLVNPIAGMGGKVGLKGTNGAAKKAADLGAKPVSPAKALEFLTKLKELDITSRIEIITCQGIMGEKETRTAGLQAEILPLHISLKTTAADTKSAVKKLAALNVELIVFVGGDGTARDILDALSNLTSIPVLGVPSGVKMYSGVFAATSTDAAYVVQAFLERKAQIMDFEIMDVDEKAFREDKLSVTLQGILKGPFVPTRSVDSKHLSPDTIDEHENQMAVAKFIVEEMNPKGTYILGPGSTVKCVADFLGVEKTLLGVGIYQKKAVVKDVNEEKILNSVKDWKKTWLVLSPIGRQGMLLGHGNQQISPKIIKKIGREHIIVGATHSKLKEIEGGVLRVDTGDVEVDAMLRGYIKVATDYREWRLVKIK
jgi:predicted polyphosphate/ATP-dependent NAD kinase